MKKFSNFVLAAVVAISTLPMSFAGDHNNCDNAENCAGNAFCSNDNRSMYITTLTDLSQSYPKNAQLKLYIHDVGAKKEINLSETEVRTTLTNMGIKQSDINHVVDRLSMSDNSN